MSSSTSNPPILLHATPGLAPLPASDAESLYFASLFELACPGRWAVTSGDWGLNGGKLPYITHLGHQIRPNHLPSLHLFEDIDAGLSREDKVDSLCWKAYIEQNVVDIVNHTFYSLPPNYPETIAKSQFKDLTFPENQYIPQRLHSIVRSRLQHVGLWGVGGLNAGDAADEDRQKLDEAFVVGPAGTMAPRAWSGWRAGRDMEDRRRKWGEQELEKRIKGVFDPLVRRLNDGPYFFGDRPTTSDIALFAHLTFVLTPTLPNPLLPNLLRSSYPTLIEHHDRLLSLLFPSGSWSSVPTIPRSASQQRKQQSYYDIISSWIPYNGNGRAAASHGNGGVQGKKDGKSAKEKQFERGRWLWFAGATVAMIGYLLASGMVQIEIGGGSDGSDDEGEDEHEENEEERGEWDVPSEEEEELEEIAEAGEDDDDE
ncbi:hypothetical protein I316_06334 [Kwoniella heveanensis BCC8398]|uniref:GST C-terminal domain-containing protein n=1 Tax=Kwoniella heveanensis BCC8398 TaxID=1296120 RepID=A0A1B9GLV1_9TREE|nr:hypothetical protein I316_06334 [Kwoniella heveanensis BCC8398]